ncbi:MAG: class I SAM-dependent methyltransferase [Dehalococcoidia bacterium]
MTNESISFDCAASVYDATRKLPEDCARALTDELVRQVRANNTDRLLEIGIGTGRIARPLMREGVAVVGVDISPLMVAQLRAQLTPEHTPPELIFGDAMRLPLRDASFRAVLIVHVLHLVPSPTSVISDVRRVLAPGGILLHQTRAPNELTERLWDESAAAWDRLLQARGFQRRQRAEQPQVRALLQASGARLDLINVTQSEETSTVEQEIERIRVRQGSWTWEIPEDILVDALPEYETWLRAQLAPHDGWTDRVTLEIEVWRWP